MSESALLLLRMIGSLAVVAVLIWALTKLARTRGLGRPAQDLIDIRAQRGLSRNTSIILVQVGAKNLLLGVADGGVRVLSEGDELMITRVEDDPDDTPGGNPALSPVVTGGPRALTSGRVLDRLRDRTVRKQS